MVTTTAKRWVLAGGVTIYIYHIYYIYVPRQRGGGPWYGLPFQGKAQGLDAAGPDIASGLSVIGPSGSTAVLPDPCGRQLLAMVGAGGFQFMVRSTKCSKDAIINVLHHSAQASTLPCSPMS